jgi:conjugal transfer mating pair stabilization protein TraN
MMRKIVAVFVAAIYLVQTTVAAEIYAPGACSLVPGSKTCIDTTPCKSLSSGQLACLAGAPLPADAVAVPQTCWKYSYQYACDNAAPANTCTPYENNSACAVTASVCTDHKPETGLCSSWTYTYKCMTSAAQTTNQLNCSASLFDTNSMPTPSNPNNNFAKAALALEIARETQVYAAQDLKVFKGVREPCTKGYWGLHNCCTATPGAQSNRNFAKQIAGEAAISVAKYAGEVAIDTVSPYVFDAMYENTFTAGLMESIQNASFVVQNNMGMGMSSAVGTNMAAQGFTLSAYGFTYGTGTFEAASALPGTIDMTSTFGLDSGFVTFNPYVFAAMVALHYIMSLTQCTKEENVFQMHKGANLTVKVGDECAHRILGACVERREINCSFNSVLAKIVNIQGKTQLGLDIRNCEGLTTDQVTQIDFTRIDFTKFTGQLTEQAQAGLPKNMPGTYTTKMQTTSQGSQQHAANGLAYPPGAAPAPPPPIP